MHCKNCHSQLPSNSDYCNLCGGKVIRNRLTFKNLFEHFTETFFNYDNKLLRTFIDMFKKPEVVIDTYVQGVRKRYVNPVSFFGIILTINGLNIFILSKYFKKYLDTSQMVSDTASAENEATRKIMALSSDFSLEYGSLIFSLLIPLAALISLIVFFNKKYNYTEHIILYLYSMSIFSILSVIFGLVVLLTVPDSYMTFASAIYVFIFIYHCYIFKRLFNLSIKQLILKILLFSVVFFFFYIGISILVTILLFLTGTLNLEDFVPKKN